ncbi:amidohydrolase [Paenibacillus sp. ACRRY]|uniref:amidohydrolase n=1 Tax=Paenibacillus sp. ACRRY TaxID=2918208 RepID=UPI001EF522A9|nr:amidohydrolase [Paenibacillus sp. ACRRY]MCG7381409.1 amidohydrolase [Paenibacillus sp. ACRRY]
MRVILQHQDHPYWLRNVCLEQGYRYENNHIVGTMTGKFDLWIEKGKIMMIVEAESRTEQESPYGLSRDACIGEVRQGLQGPDRDAKGMLLLPGFREMHIHIDKTYYGGPWIAPTPPENIFKRMAEERELLPRQLKHSKERALKLLSLFQSSGVTHVRTHCNIDPQVGLGNLEATTMAISQFSDRLSCEIVAFPQHGLLRSGVVSEMREAMRRGARWVGGVDPGNVDNNIEKSLATILDIAVEADAGVDIHIHDPGQLGVFTMIRLAAMTEQAGWQGRVNVSHALAFADIGEAVQEQLAERFAELGMSITSTVPLNRWMPYSLLKKHGVRVELGEDTITDHWGPFGRGDMLERAGRLAERERWSSERGLAETLGYITGGITPLDDRGNMQWPRPGDDATAVLVEASCSAEAVARRSTRGGLLYKGLVVNGEL